MVFLVIYLPFDGLEVRLSLIVHVISVILVTKSVTSESLAIEGTEMAFGIATAATAMWLCCPTEERVYAAACDYRDSLLEAFDSETLR